MAIGRGVRRGAHMSTKVLARAAVEGRSLSLMIPGLPGTRGGVPGTVDGYLVGMDDFHLQIAEVSGSEVHVALVHKSVPLIILTGAFLSDEHEDAQNAVKKIGEAFWKYCAETHLGQNGNKESQ